MISAWIANNRKAVTPPDPIDLWKAGLFVAGNTAFGWGYGKPPLISSELGTLVEEPYADGSLIAFFEAPDDSRIIVCFTGDVVGDLTGYTFTLNGAKLAVESPALYSPDNDWTIMFLEAHWMIDGDAYVIARVPE